MRGTNSRWRKLREKKYREEFVASQARRAIPFQIRALMHRKKISQQELADRSGLTQGVISRAANPAYGNLTLNTIIRVAAGFDVAFIGLFVPFSKLVDFFDRVSERGLADVATFTEEDATLEAADIHQDNAETMARLNELGNQPPATKGRAHRLQEALERAQQQTDFRAPIKAEGGASGRTRRVPPPIQKIASGGQWLPF
jgi:transcriptional regulator with XRE-family HTH domain